MQKFRKLDIFKKVPTDLSQGTNLGGFISILAAVSIVYFTVSQITKFLNPPEFSNIILDSPMTRKQLQINIDIEFPRFPCQIIALDLQDQMMSHHANIGSVKKYRLDQNGQRLDAQEFQLLKQPDMFKQYEMAKKAFENKYGCRLRGSFTVKQVPGNFHISSHSYQGIYLNLARSNIIPTLDVSHKIHQLFFGQAKNLAPVKNYHKQAQLTALNGHSRIYDMKTPHSYTSHYHLDIVPTVYSGFKSYQTYQYTYNHNSFQVNHMPALYFNYHIGGTRVRIYASQGPFTTFLLNMCAVIGGIYAIAHFLYNFAYGLFGAKHSYVELGQ